MSSLLSHDDIITRMGHKFLIAGLAEAGKTAVKRIFFLKQVANDVAKLNATIDYERMTFIISDTPITVVDLGGQKIFIKRFLSNFSPFIFSNVKSFIFLIDVSEKTTRNDSIRF